MNENINPLWPIPNRCTLHMVWIIPTKTDISAAYDFVLRVCPCLNWKRFDKYHAITWQKKNNRASNWRCSACYISDQHMLKLARASATYVEVAFVIITQNGWHEVHHKRLGGVGLDTGGGACIIKSPCVATVLWKDKYLCCTFHVCNTGLTDRLVSMWCVILMPLF